MNKETAVSIRCPECNCAHAPEDGSTPTRVFSTRHGDEVIIRVRECRYCGRRFRTRETIEAEENFE